MESREEKEWFERLSLITKQLYSDFPPNRKCIEIKGTTPISYRANRSDKIIIEEVIRAQTNIIPSICTEDISIDIEWKINDRERYETDKTPDIDNIIKPIFDSLCGPEGVIVDDCQVVSLKTTCIGGWVNGYNRFDLKIHLPEDGYYKNNGCIPKDKIQIVNLGKGLYFPINKEEKSEKELVRYYCDWVYNKNDNQADEGSMLLRRFFHKSRVTSFSPLIEADGFLNKK